MNVDNTPNAYTDREPHFVARLESPPDARVTDLRTRYAMMRDGVRMAKLAVLCLVAGTVMLAVWVTPFPAGLVFGSPPLLVAVGVWMARAAAARKADRQLKAHEAASF